MTELKALQNHLVDLQLRNDDAQHVVAWAVARIMTLSEQVHPSFGHDRTVLEEMLDSLTEARRGV